MKFVVDTNVVISALIKDSLTRSLIFNPKFNLFLPDFSLQEIEKYAEEIQDKSGMGKEEFDLLLKLILSNFLIVKKEKYEKYIEETEKICVDKKDVVFLALALSLKIPLWSEDKNLRKQNRVKIYSTRELKNLINSPLSQ